MRAERTPDGEIHLYEVPAGAVPIVVDDAPSPFGTLPLAIQMRLPGGRIVSVPIRPADAPRKR